MEAKIVMLLFGMIVISIAITSLFLILGVLAKIIDKAEVDSRETSPDKEAYEYLKDIQKLCEKHKIVIGKGIWGEEYEERMRKIWEYKERFRDTIGLNSFGVKEFEYRNWLGTDEGFEACRLVLAEHNISLMTVRNTLQESVEWLNRIPQEVEDEVVSVMELIYSDIEKMKRKKDREKRVEEQAVIDSLTGRMQEEKKFIQDRSKMKL